MQLFDKPGKRLLVLLSAGNLATTESVVSMLRQRAAHDPDSHNIYTVRSMYDAAELVGETLKQVVQRDAGGQTQGGVDFGCSFILGGQISGEAPRLFNIYPQGNFIEATPDTPYFQIGESKYGKPIIDRVISYQTPVQEAAKCALISFDSTIKSNLSVGLPIDLLLYQRDSLQPGLQRRICEQDDYFLTIRNAWGDALRQAFAALPPLPW
jgi:putative proteasome-type protease